MKNAFRMMRKRWKTTLLLVGLLVPCVSFFVVRKVRSAPNLPTATAQRKVFVDYKVVRGEVKALRSVTISAPAGVGDLLILKILPTGTKVKKGDTLVEFDASMLLQRLAQDRSALKSAEATIEQSKAQDNLKEQQDLTDIMTSKFDLQSARLDASKQEILSAIEGEKAALKVNDAEQKMIENKTKLESDRVSAQSNLASKVKLRDRAAFQVKQDEAGIASLVLHAPLDGTFAVLTHWEPTGYVPYKPGDRAWPGAGLAELPDTSTLRISARVEEADRGQMHTGQAVSVHLDAIPDRMLTGKVEEISPTASMDFTGGWPIPRNFSIEISLTDKDPRLAPGMSAVARVAVDQVPDAVIVPVGAVFRKSGSNVAYVLRGSKYVQTTIEVSRRTTDEALITGGLIGGERVALLEPSTTE